MSTGTSVILLASSCFRRKLDALSLSLTCLQHCRNTKGNRNAPELRYRRVTDPSSTNVCALSGLPPAYFRSMQSEGSFKALPPALFRMLSGLHALNLYQASTQWRGVLVQLDDLLFLALQRSSRQLPHAVLIVDCKQCISSARPSDFAWAWVVVSTLALDLENRIILCLRSGQLWQELAC
jgi:hypothetical protein